MSLISSSRWKGQVAGNAKKYWPSCPACRARVLQIWPLFNPHSPTNPMLTERTVSSSGLSWRSGTSCQSSQASLSRTFQEVTWRTGQQLAWKTALLCKLDWTQGCHSVPWRLQQTCSKASTMTWEKCLKEALAFCADVSTVARLSYQILPGWDWDTSYCLLPGSSSANIGEINRNQWVWSAEVPRNTSPHDVCLHFVKTSC